MRTCRAQAAAWAIWLSLAVAGQAAAQDNDEAFHFDEDPDRVARIDDRGGMDDGYAFNIGYDPDDSNSENFCPHCRLVVVAADPGIDMDDLEILGITRDDIEALEDLAEVLHRIATEDARSLAESIRPELEGGDLEAFTAEVERIIGAVASVLEALDGIVDVVAGDVDFTMTDLVDLLADLGLEMDTGFQADFADRNDPRRYNSGVDVYDLRDLLLALEAEGIPDAARTAIADLLESIPSLAGTLELSGDDSSVLDPVVFHGRHTDLTIRQRSYVVGFNNAYLITYTLVNDTDRVLPFVEVGMVADFDVPAGSSDTESGFEPITQTVMTYDVLPYEDPEEHWWFGLSPAYPLVPTAEDFVFGNWAIDDRLSLSQTSPTSQTDRYRFMLWDPAVSFDQDSADGKSEKQGAVSMVLPGPMFPGDQREVAFCYAGAVAEDSATAQVDMLAIMAACHGLFQILHAECGDGMIQYGEQCDDDNGVSGDGCSADCQLEVCGDSTITGAEECDDGNAASNDGCSSTCRVEYCGDGIVQASGFTGEECDDGNLSNGDSCLTTCERARCGDGYLRSCAEGETGCGCVGYEYCFSGHFTITSVPTDGTGTIIPIRGTRLDFVAGFDAERAISGDPRRYVWHTGPVHMEISGDPLATEIADSLEGGTWTLSLQASGMSGATFSTSTLLGPSRGGPAWGMSFTATGAALTFRTGTDGLPDLGAIGLNGGVMTLGYGETVAGSWTASDVGDGPLFARILTTSLETGGSEACDDGNTSDFDSCTAACLPAACGDGFLQTSEGEVCDDANVSDGDGCSATCQLEDEAACGDGDLDPAEGCDDGNDVAGDGCSPTCVLEVCGNGVVEPGEECDDGRNGDGDGCTDDCVLESCGDGVPQPSEECDEGAANADDGDCLTTCASARCGDGHVHAIDEGCDDGNTEPGDGCSALCVVELCGDGADGPDEECDDGNDVEADGCSPDCRLEYCGDARPGPDEQCDDGNTVDGDGCNKDCMMENLAACGDSVVGIGEQCDDGGRANGDGCNEFCQLENPGACGNGRVDPGEGCDDGNDEPGDGCTPFCTEERCGDGIHNWGEECDDGNIEPGDGCTRCRADEAECGNGVQEYGEQCDDGPGPETPGCDDDCRVSPPGAVDVRTTCGDGVQDLGEECDDGAHEDGDGCDELCQLEPAVCGNGRLERGETCDDGNEQGGDSCGRACTPEGCGNGLLEPHEACDDGNTADDDGCSSSCEVERCGDGIVQANEDCDLAEENGGPDCSEDCQSPADEGGCSCSAPGDATREAAPWLLLVTLALAAPRLRRR